MTDRADFLDAIAADPRDDAVRLVYADWLDEHDEPKRAELIRLQIDLAADPNKYACFFPRPYFRAEVFSVATCGHCSRCRALARLHARQRELVIDLSGKMSDALGGLFEPYGIRRGFVSNVTCSWHTWEAGGDRLSAIEYVPFVSLHTVPRPHLQMSWTAGGEYVDCWVAGRTVRVDRADLPGFNSTDPAVEWQQFVAVVLNRRWPRTAFPLPNLLPPDPP